MRIQGFNKIYIIHYIKLKERRDYLEKRLKELGLEDYVIWVVSEKDGSFSKKELAMWDESEKTRLERKRLLGDKIPPIGRIDMIMMLQHLRVLRKIAQSKNKAVSMVFEDDVLLDEDFPEKLQKAIELLKKEEWDICYTDKGSLLVNPKIKENKDIVNLYEPLDKRANTTGSFLINQEGAKKLLDLMKKISLGPDMELTYVQRKNKLKVYWTVPFLTHQGSIEEIYQSSVRTGSLVGRVLRITKKVEKFSPGLANLIARLGDFTLKVTYKSKILFVIKNKIKRLMKL